MRLETELRDPFSDPVTELRFALEPPVKGPSIEQVAVIMSHRRKRLLLFHLSNGRNRVSGSPTLSSGGNMQKACLLTACLVVASTPAIAAQYRFTATGTLAAPYTADKTFAQVPNPSMVVNEGDHMSVSFLFETSDMNVTALYDANPAINIYGGFVTNYRLSAGVYVNQPAANAHQFVSWQLWDGYQSGSNLVDAFTFSTLSYIPSGTSPVDLGAGQINQQYHFSGFDFTASARGSDKIDEITPLDAFGSQTSFIAFFNGNSLLQTHFQIRNLRASISAVPETSTWIMMLVGWAAIGAALRTASGVRPARAGRSA